MAEEQGARELTRGSSSRHAVERRWPELFEEMSEDDRRAVLQGMAAALEGGWVPSREEVENLTDEARGAIGEDEALRRADAVIDRNQRVEQAIASFEIEGVIVSHEARSDARQFIAGRIELEELHERARARRSRG